MQNPVAPLPMRAVLTVKFSIAGSYHYGEPVHQVVPGQSTTLTASSNPPGATYTWFRNGAVPGASGNTFFGRI